MKKYIIIALGVLIFILILFGITYLESLKNVVTTNPNSFPSPTLVANQRESILYEQKGASKMLKNMQERPTPVIPKDTTIKNQLISLLPDGTGTINATEDYELKYVKGPNIFEAKILAEDTVKAKADIIIFLIDKGLSEDGICKLPIIFYLDFELSKKMKSKGQKFNPVPDFCI